MLAREEQVEAHALRAQGWSVSAIARHLGRDRKTVRAYLSTPLALPISSRKPRSWSPTIPSCITGTPRRFAGRAEGAKRSRPPSEPIA